MILFRIAVAALALIMMAFGLIAMIAPTPFGFVLVLLGFLLLASASPNIVRWLRKRWRRLDRGLDVVQDRGPDWIAKPLKRSSPNEPDDAEPRKEAPNS